MVELTFGKKSTHESYYKGILKGRRTEYSIPEVVKDKSQALNEMMKGLELITSSQTHRITFTVEADAKTHAFKMVTKSWVIDE